MTKSYIQIQAEISKLQVQAEALREKEVAGVVSRIKEAISHYGLSIADLGLGPAGAKRGRKPGVKAGRLDAVAKFADGQGNTWVGRGPRPKWLREALQAGRTLEEFAVGGGAAPANNPSAPGKRAGRPAKAAKAVKATRGRGAANPAAKKGGRSTGKATGPKGRVRRGTGATPAEVSTADAVAPAAA